MITNQESGYWILGYPRNTNYEDERKRRKKVRSKEYNTLYKCSKCLKVWENFISYRKQFIAYTDMPSYGLNRKDCKICTNKKELNYG